MGFWIERIPTDDNISDLPSRESYGLMRAMGAVWVAPKLDEAFREPCIWESNAMDDPVLPGPRTQTLRKTKEEERKKKERKKKS